MRPVACCLAVALGGASACQAGTEANLVDVNGTWTFSEVLEDKAHGISCRDSGTYAITQMGDAFRGIYAQRGSCLTPTGPVDNADSGTVEQGMVVGHTIRFRVTANCEYEGNATGMPAVELTGRGACVLQDVDRTLSFLGTWRARR